MLSADDIMKNMVCGLPTNSAINYFQNQLQSIKNVGSSLGNWVMDKARDIFNFNTSEKVLNESRRLLMETGSHFRDDGIHNVYYNNYNPNLMMQRYIMADPIIYGMYKKDMLDGFGGTYMDAEPYLRDRTWSDDYMRAIDGVIQYGDDEDDGYVYHCYSSHSDVNNLNLVEQNIINDSWEVARYFLKKGKDPTKNK